MVRNNFLKKRIAIVLSIALALTVPFGAYADEISEPVTGAEYTTATPENALENNEFEEVHTESTVVSNVLSEVSTIETEGTEEDSEDDTEYNDLPGKNIHSSEMGYDEDIYEDEDVDEDIYEEGYADSDVNLLMTDNLCVLGIDTSQFNYGPYNSYAEIFMEAARVTGMNPFVMVAMIKQEMGDGSSPLVTGAGIDGEYKGIYNFINYQAYAADGMSARERGLWWANGEGKDLTSYGRPWDSPERAILRGMGIMAANYLEMGQETYYFKKFNVNPLSISKGHTLYGHQYMTNVNGANGEGTILGNFYRTNDYDDANLEFLIPVYNNMPTDPVKKPDGQQKTISTYTPTRTDSYVQTIRDTFSGYPGYVDLLLKLHDKYPDWKFTKVNTGLDWNAAVSAETSPSLNLVPGSWDAVWKSDNIEHDSGGWVGASKTAVSYYMDPRNFLIDDACVFQFMNHAYDTSSSTVQTLANVEKMCQGSFLGNAIKRNAYTVKWLNYDGTVLETNYSLNYGDVPEYTGATPTRAYKNGTVYVFNGWDKSIEAVTENTSYKATYEEVEIGKKPAEITEDSSYTQTGSPSVANLAKTEILNNTEVNETNSDLIKELEFDNYLSDKGIVNDELESFSIAIKLQLKNIEAATTDSKVEKVVFSIYPEITVKKQNESEYTEALADDYLSGNSISIKIPVPANRDGEYAHINHKRTAGDVTFKTPIKGSGSNRYVECEIKDFSDFEITFTDTYYSVGEVSGTYRENRGAAICPSVSVKDGNTDLVKGTDYKLSYMNNNYAGTATVRVTFINSGDYVDRYFEIKAKSSGGGSGDGGGGGSSKKTTQTETYATFSKFWFTDTNGTWKVKDNTGKLITTAWLCDDAITANGNNVWYLLNTDGSMMSAGLVQDNTGNFYSLETDHDGYFGMLRYKNGYYNCNGQQIYLEFEQSHNGSFAAVKNADGLAKLKEIYGTTYFGVDNSNIVNTIRF